MAGSLPRFLLDEFELGGAFAVRGTEHQPSGVVGERHSGRVRPEDLDGVVGQAVQHVGHLEPVGEGVGEAREHVDERVVGRQVGLLPWVPSRRMS